MKPSKKREKPKIKVENVGKIYRGEEGETVALDGISLDVYEGEFVSIIGPSGCGKSTLLYIIAGLYDQTSGQVYLDGEPIEGPENERGMVFQERGLFPWMTVEENVSYGLKIRGMAKEKIEKRVQDFIKFAGLKGFEENYIHQLSGGMKSRVGLIRALANDPEILLMDEPFGDLDELTKEILQEELERLWEETQKTVIFVTHDIEEAVFLSDRIGVMTNRPGTFREIKEIKLERPRRKHYPDRSEEKFIEEKSSISGTLKQEAKEGMTLNL